MKTDLISADLEIRHQPRQLLRPSDVKRGDTINFIYEGGNDPGKPRTVLVTDGDCKHVRGICLERNGEFRNFFTKDMKGTKIAPPFVKKNVTVTYELVSLVEYMQALMAK